MTAPADTIRKALDALGSHSHSRLYEEALAALDELEQENRRLREAAMALFEEVEMAESVGVCLPDRTPSLVLRDLLAAAEEPR